MEYACLKDVCSIIMGQSPESSSYNEDGEGVPFFQGNADFGEVYPCVRVWSNEPKKMASTNDILISVRAPIGALNYAKEDCCIGRGLAAITPSSRVNLKYIYYLLRAKNSELNSKGTGSTFKAIGKSVLEETLVPMLSIGEQVKIVSKIESAEGIIRKRREQLLELDNLIKSRFVEMFGDLKTNSKGWETKLFNELTDLITDGEHSTPRRKEEGIYLLSARNVLNHSLQLEDVDYIDGEEYERIGKRVVPQEGDVLISCSGTVGRCCSVPAGMQFQMVRSIALLRFKKNINPVFAEYMITSDYLQEQINSSKTASSQANLFQGKIAKLKGFVPPIELQNEFVDFVYQVIKLKFFTNRQIEITYKGVNRFGN